MMDGFQFKYERLLKRVNSEPCYRGSKNRYPLFTRNNLRYYILAEQEDGQVVFDLCYGKTFERVSITEEEFIEHQKAKRHAAGEVGERWMYIDKPNRMLRVRPDDTVEFIGERYHQGDRHFLSKLAYGIFTNDSRRGGVIYRVGNKIVPIFKGMRVNYRMKPIGDVKINILHVNRTKSKQLVKQYETFFKVAQTMTSAMTDLDEWAKLVRDVFEEHCSEKIMFDEPAIMEKALSMLNNAPLDALILSAIHNDTRYMRNMARTGVQVSWSKTTPSDVFELTKRSLTKALYLSNPDTFTPKVFAFGDAYPCSDWPIEVTLNGEPVERYGYSAE